MTTDNTRRDPIWLRKAGRVLASLLQAGDEEMAAFARERLEGAELDPARLADARAMLIVMAEILLGDRPEKVMGLAHARRLLEDWKPPEPAPAEPLPPAPRIESPPPAPSPHPGHRVDPPLPAGPAGPSPWVAPTPARPKMPGAADPFNATAAVGHVASPRLPFTPGPAKAPPRVTLEPHAAMGQTAPAKAPPESGALPFGPESFTLERYAQFCAERERWPAHRAQTCANHRLVESDEDALHQRFRSALAQDPALAARFEALREEARRRF